MSVVPPDVTHALTQLLQGLSSSDNDLRSQAEEQLNNEWVVARPDVLLMGLVDRIYSDSDPVVRSALDIHNASGKACY